MATKSDEATGKGHEVPIKSGNDILKYYGGESAKAVEKPVPAKTDNNAIVNIVKPPEGTSKTVDSVHNKGDEKKDKDKEDKGKDKDKEDKGKDKDKEEKEKDKDKEEKVKDKEKDKEEEKEKQKEKEKEKEKSSATTSTDAGQEKMNKMLENLFSLYKAKTAAASGGAKSDKTKGEKPKDVLPEPQLKRQDPTSSKHTIFNITLNDPDLRDKMKKEEASILALIRTNYNIEERTHAQLAKGFVKSKDFPSLATPLTAHLASAEVGNSAPTFREVRKDDVSIKTSDKSAMIKDNKLTDELRTMGYDVDVKSIDMSMVKRNDGNGNQQSGESSASSSTTSRTGDAAEADKSEEKKIVDEEKHIGLKTKETSQVSAKEDNRVSDSTSTVTKDGLAAKTTTALQPTSDDNSVKLSDTTKPESKDVELGHSQTKSNDVSTESTANASQPSKSDIVHPVANISEIANTTAEGTRPMSFKINKEKAEKIINENIEKAIASEDELGPHLSFNQVTLNTKKNAGENIEEVEDKKEDRVEQTGDTLSSSSRIGESDDNQTMAMKFSKEKVEQLLNQHLITQSMRKKKRKRHRRKHHHKKDGGSSEDDEDDENEDEEDEDDDERDDEEDDYVDASEKLKNKLKEEQPAPEYAYTKARKVLKELVRLKMNELKNRKKKLENNNDFANQDKVDSNSYNKNSSDTNASDKDEDVNKKLERIRQEKERLLKEEEQLKEKQKTSVKPPSILSDSSPLHSVTNSSNNQTVEAEVVNKTAEGQSQSSQAMSLQKPTYHLHGLEPEVQSYKQQEQQQAQQEQQKQKFQQTVKEKATSVGHKDQEEVSSGIQQKPAENSKDKQDSKTSETKPSESSGGLNKNNSFANATTEKTKESKDAPNSKDPSGGNNKIQDHNADDNKETSSSAAPEKVDHMLTLAAPSSNAEQNPKPNKPDKQDKPPEQQKGGVDHKLNLAKGGSNGGSDDSSMDAQYVKSGSRLHHFQNSTIMTTSNMVADNKHLSGIPMQQLSMQRLQPESHSMQINARGESTIGPAVGLKHRYVKMGDTTYSPYEYYSFRTDAKKSESQGENKNSNVAKKSNDLMELNVPGRGKVD